MTAPGDALLADLLALLAPRKPALAGTFPLGLQGAGSDLDVLCEGADLDAFEREVCAFLAARAVAPSRVARVASAPEASVVAFGWGGLAIEVFCQPLPFHAQAGFRHMIVEGRLLVAGGSALHDEVRARKSGGAKTEPAFAAALGLDGDPYAALLALEDAPGGALRATIARARRAPLLDVAPYTGDRAALLPLFRLADDSEAAIARALPLGTVLVATQDGAHVGHAQLVETGEPGTIELASIAVIAAARDAGAGRALVEAAVEHARRAGARTLVVATATADVGNLRFYQRMGFRFARVERDAFTPARGYPEGLSVDGIPLRDRIWLDRALG